MIVVYSLGYKQASDSRDAKEAKADLDWQKEHIEINEEIRKRYLEYKSNTPNDWGIYNQLRSPRKVQQTNKTNGTSNS